MNLFALMASRFGQGALAKRRNALARALAKVPLISRAVEFWDIISGLANISG